MGLRGPAPKPTELKILEGTFRPDRATETPPVPAANKPEMPAWVKADADARFEWDCALAEAPWIRKADTAVLEGHCASFSRFRKARRHLARRGQVVKTIYGLKTNPSVTIERDATAALAVSSGRLGLDPSSRTRINVPATPSQGTAKRDFLLGRRKAGA